MSTFLTALDAEITALEAEVKADPRLVKLNELRRVRALYANRSTFVIKPPPVHHVALSPSPPPQPQPQPRLPLLRRGGRKPSPVRVKALQEAKAFLKDKAQPTKTTDIHDHLTAAGIVLAGEDPTNNLSALLYRSPDFRSHGRSGWTLQSGG
jgi:hypothetical protein